MNVRVIGIDLGKTIFHQVGMDDHGNLVLKKRFSRTQLMKFLVNMPPCLIGIWKRAAAAITSAGIWQALGTMCG